MNLEKNYALLEVLRDDGIRTQRAREISSGRSLEVHFFAAENRNLFDELRGLPLSARRDLLEIGYEGQLPYIVTDPLPGETNARAWFTKLVRPVESKPEIRVKAGVWKAGTPLPDPLFPPDPEGSQAGAGEFTRMFQVPAARPAPPAAPPQAPPEPGEFTRMFQTPSNPAPPPEPPAIDERDQPTRLFQAPPAAPPPIAEAPRQPSGPSEFTRFFQSPLQPAPLKENLPGADPFAEHLSAPPKPPAPNRPGEFTQMFGNPSRGAPPEPLAGASATGAFAAPKAPPAGRPLAQGPGEFTQMMSGGSGPTLGQQPPPQQATPVKPRDSKLPLLLILGAALLFAILIVVFFAMRRR